MTPVFAHCLPASVDSTAPDSVLSRQVEEGQHATTQRLAVEGDLHVFAVVTGFVADLQEQRRLAKVQCSASSQRIPVRYSLALFYVYMRSALVRN
jgi:hypothetical protein